MYVACMASLPQVCIKFSMYVLYIHIYMDLMNMGVNRRVLLVEHEHVHMSAFVQHHLYQSYTSVHKEPLPHAPLMQLHEDS